MIVNINFSNQFVENSTDDKQRYNSIYTIVKTLTELTEVNEIKIIIDGKEIDGFIESGLDFKQKFNIKMFEQQNICAFLENMLLYTLGELINMYNFNNFIEW